MSRRRQSDKILVTKDYRMFERNPENRPVDDKKHRRLKRSMEKYGFLSCFPIVVERLPNGKLRVKEGQ